jgi:DUF1680 family protein
VPTWANDARCTLNRRPVAAEPCEKGYLRLRREWSTGDEIVLELPLRVRAIGAANEIDAVRDCAAFERGPLVYCIEGIDLPEAVNLRAISVDASVPPGEERGFGIATDTVVALRLEGRAAPSRSGWPYGELSLHGSGEAPTASATDPGKRAVEVRAIPYYAWGNRGATSMRVWIPRNSEPVEQWPCPPAKEAPPID